MEYYDTISQGYTELHKEEQLNKARINIVDVSTSKKYAEIIDQLKLTLSAPGI